MDRNLDIDNFERLLKERSDEFKMYPTKRVWYSIYNNIHPGRKWPSVATSIILIAILLLVGYINTGNKNTSFASTHSVQSNPAISVNLSLAFNDPFLEGRFIDIQKPQPVTVLAENPTLNISGITPGNTTYEAKKIAASIPRNGLIPMYKKYEISTGISALNKYNLQAITSVKNSLVKVEINNNIPEYFLTESNIISQNNSVDVQSKTKSAGEVNSINDNENNSTVTFADVNDAKNKNTSINQPTNTLAKKKDALLVEASRMTEEDKAWIENYALYNRPAPKKWAGKLKSQMYFTPSVVYRQLTNILSAGQDIDNVVIQHPSFGLEIGAGIVYPLLKGVNVKTGVQLNFTRYNAVGFGNSHPVATTITMISGAGQPYPSFRSTPYSNTDGITPLQLHNETFQISIPIGMDLKILGSDNLQWNIGATIQPTYVMGGKSFIISSDKRNYVKETDLMNRLNLNAGFETFISYKTNGYTLQFGPQFRKQLFTTNSKQYSIEEKLTNYGLKFGITKLLK